MAGPGGRALGPLREGPAPEGPAHAEPRPRRARSRSFLKGAVSTRLATAWKSWKSRHKSSSFRGRQTSEPGHSRGRPGLRGRGRGAAGTEWPPAWPAASAQGRANVIKGSSVPPPACPRARRRFPHGLLDGRGAVRGCAPFAGGWGFGGGDP